MSEELKSGNEEVQVEDTNIPEQTQQQETPELSDIEKRAMEMGWRPKEEFEGDESDFIDAKEFVRRKPLFDKIDHQGRELKEVRKALKMLQDHHVKVKENEYRRALEDLRNEKKTALREGDEDRLVEIDEQIAEIKAAEIVEKQQANVQNKQPHPNFLRWVDKNKWYAQSPEMRSVADNIGVQYASNNPELSADEVLSYVEKRIKTIYKDSFQNPNKNRPPAVEGSSTNQRQVTPKKEDFALTEDERRAMNTFVREGLMTKEEYINELKRVKGVV